nr:AdeC/AdeK/OprM family multidrug efflux complex outer membrane factor [Pseudomonas sp. WS 5013]
MSLAVASILLGGCSLIPDYQRPASPVESLWPSEAGGAQTATAAADLDWRVFFKDPALQGLIDTALANNRDLRVAALNVEAYAAQRQIQRSALFPGVTADGGATRQRLPGSLSSSGEPSISSQYSATLGASWELDLFGRLRSLDEQALQQYFATEEARRATQIALVASVANAWLTLQADQELLQLTQDTLKTYQQSFALTQRSYDVGVADALALAQARSAVESAQVSLAQYSRQVAQDRNALVVLLGSGKAGGLPAGQPLDDDLLLEVPAGLPSDLLQRRPDLRQAEHQLQAANANIGAARAAFFPSVSLTANAGSLSPDLAGLFDAGSGSWLFQPSISLPIFNAGKLRASLDYAELQKDIQVASYEKAIQTAFQEVADGLAARATYQQQLDAQRALVKTNEEYYRLAERRYRTGVDSYLALLDAQRQLFSVRQQLIGDRLAQLTSEVELYKALGGGWSEPSQLASAPAQD